jgi:NAD(P)-dependent dehydrogenase (short-subunit alcohol dehydrogenase family)
MNKMLLENKVVIVTGGAGFLGEQFCKVIAQAKGTPIILDINSKKGNNICKKINHLYSCNMQFYKCDVSKENEVKKVLSKLIKKFKDKKIFGLINNAAYNPQPSKSDNNKFENFNLDLWEKELKVGLNGVLICSKIFGTYFAKNGEGSIINISSDLGIIAPKQSIYRHINYTKPMSYTVIKHAIHGITKYICSYWGKSKVRCNTLAPGGVFNHQDKKFISNIKKEIPANRMANKEDLDGSIIYFLSDYSKFTNGSLLSIDGGRTII